MRDLMSEVNATESTPTEEATTETVETDWKAEARKWEARAKENLAKATENESAAQRIREIEDANKTELEKATARAEAAEARLTETTFNAMKARVASKFEIAEEDIELFLTGTDEDTLTKQAERLASRVAKSDPEVEVNTHESNRIGFGVDLKDRDPEKTVSADDDLARQIFGI